MKELTLTGEQLFLRYAFACAQNMLSQGKLTKEQIQDLEQLIVQNRQPDRDVLKHRFPKPFHSYNLYTRDKKLSIPWSYASVSDFWRHHHCHPDQPQRRDVRLVTVCEITGNPKIVFAQKGETTIPVVNQYHLDLAVGDQVYIHRNVVVEKT